MHNAGITILCIMLNIYSCKVTTGLTWSEKIRFVLRQAMLFSICFCTPKYKAEWQLSANCVYKSIIIQSINENCTSTLMKFHKQKLDFTYAYLLYVHLAWAQVHRAQHKHLKLVNKLLIKSRKIITHYLGLSIESIQ